MTASTKKDAALLRALKTPVASSARPATEPAARAITLRPGSMDVWDLTYPGELGAPGPFDGDTIRSFAENGLITLVSPGRYIAR
jgi:hypothetical protein